MRAVASVAPWLLFVGCAATAPHGAPGPQSALRTAAVAPPVGDENLVPDGANRLASSLDCEPQPPCEHCLLFKGAKALRDGSLDKQAIRSVVGSNLSKVRACYDAAAAANPDGRGRVMVRFGITPSGRVATSCLVSSELHDPSVERCVVDLPFGWSFPKPDGGGWVVVSYPFVFDRAR